MIYPSAFTAVYKHNSYEYTLDLQHYWGLLQRDTYKAVTSLTMLSEVREFWRRTLLSPRKSMGRETEPQIGKSFPGNEFYVFIVILCLQQQLQLAVLGLTFFRACQIDGRKDVKEQIWKKVSFLEACNANEIIRMLMFKEAWTFWNKTVHGLYQSDVLMRTKMPPLVCQAKISLFLRTPLTYP